MSDTREGGAMMIFRAQSTKLCLVNLSIDQSLSHSSVWRGCAALRYQLVSLRRRPFLTSPSGLVPQSALRCSAAANVDGREEKGL